MRYMLQRLAEAIFSLALILTLTFFALRLLPSGPFDEETAFNPEIQARLETQYGLHKPMFEQLTLYVGHLWRFDLGESYRYNGQTIGSIFRQTLPVSFTLGLVALLLAVCGGVALGLWTAAIRGSSLERILSFFSIVVISLPTYVMGPLLVFVFSFQLEWLPPGLWGSFANIILPSLTLALRPLSLVWRLVQRSACEVLVQDYIRTARAKGVGTLRLLLKHTLKNALAPLLAIAGPLIAELLTGAFVVEMIFAIPGLGRHFVESVANRDYPLILATTLLFSSILILSNSFMDILHRWLDRRVVIS